MELNTTRVGKRGTVVIPAELRRKYRLDEGSLLVAEEKTDGILLRPVVAVPVEIYSPERQAEFLLNNVTDLTDYAWAKEEVRKLGLDPNKIPHEKPKK
jgi:AbrB family looped-hinge helix DNA binding protein